MQQAGEKGCIKRLRTEGTRVVCNKKLTQREVKKRNGRVFLVVKGKLEFSTELRESDKIETRGGLEEHKRVAPLNGEFR